MLPTEKEISELQESGAAGGEDRNAPTAQRQQEAWKWYHARANEEIDKRLDESATQRSAQLRRHDTTGFWYSWCSTIEEGHIAARKLPSDKAKPVRGRGSVQLGTIDTHAPYAEHRAGEGNELWGQNTLHEAPKSLKASRMVQQLSNLASQQRVGQ